MFIAKFWGTNGNGNAMWCLIITRTFTQIILKWIGFFSYLSDLKLTIHHTYVMHYLIIFVTGGILCYPTLQEMLLVKGWLIGRWTLKKKKKLVIHWSCQGRSRTIQMGFSQSWWFLELFAYKSGHKKSIDCILTK